MNENHPIAFFNERNHTGQAASRVGKLLVDVAVLKLAGNGIAAERDDDRLKSRSIPFK
jgi:hypothetical protein